jgi:hypothetical protein
MRLRNVTTVLSTVALLASIVARSSAADPVDFQKLVSRADLDYTAPASRSEEGMPVGNGRMGSLVWTTPSALKFQINRTDVFAENATTSSFPERHSDYLGGCGYVDINLVDYGNDVFTGGAFHQHLSAYDGLMTADGHGVSARVLAAPAQDVMAVEINDRRSHAPSITVDLRMLRYAMQYVTGRNYTLATNHTVEIRTRSHTAASTIEIRDGCIVLVQRFHEGGYDDASAVAIGVAGRRSQARYLNDSTVQLAAAPGKGTFTVLIASAASFQPGDDVAARALAELNAAANTGFAGLRKSTTDWWHHYWSRGFVQMHSTDGEADFVEQNYTYFLYLMGASSRGNFPPRFGGMLWMTTGDMMEWGSQFWWNNMDCYYGGLLPANRLELLNPLFSMYTGQYAAAARAARQEWGSQGIYIPETGYFDGMEALPDDIATELRDLYLERKPWEQRSAAFKRYAEAKNPHNSRWNWMAKSDWADGHYDIIDRGAGPHGPVVHLFHSQAKIAHLYWQRYQYSMDKEWLRNAAYPMLKGVAEFYRNFPNTSKGADGKYHIHDVNNSEGIWGATDSLEDMAAMHGIFPTAIRASEILNVDPDLRATWREFLDNLAPLPTLTNGTWVVAHPPVVHGDPDRPGLTPAIYYDLVNAATSDGEILRQAGVTYDSGATNRLPVPTLSPIATVAAHLGRGEDLRLLMPSQLRAMAAAKEFCDWAGSGKAGVMRNRLTLREGPGAIDAERLGRVTRGVHEGLLQSGPAVPGGDPVISVFPAWPKEWDAEFSLLARGNFIVTSAIGQGRIQFVEIKSQAGADCTVRNPWSGATLEVLRNGASAPDVSGDTIRFSTSLGEEIRLIPKPL